MYQYDTKNEKKVGKKEKDYEKIKEKKWGNKIDNIGNFSNSR